MKRYLLFVCLTLLAQNSSAQTFYQMIQDEKQSGRISEIQAVYLEALRAFQPDQLPENYRDGGLPIKSATGLLMAVRHHWSSLNPEQRAVLRPHLQRPDPPVNIVSPSGRFRIHYNTVGSDAVPSADLDESGIPDYVEETARTADTVYVVEVETLGFQPPPEDLGEDGWEYDIYIINLYWAYGYTEWETQLSTDPDTYTSFIVIDNNYTGFPTPFLDGMRVTVAHEFNHMIQFGYNVRDDDENGWPDDLFIMEATSTWMEDVVYDGINDYVYYLRDFFRDTNVPFNYDDGLRMYGLCIWFHFLEERLGNRTIGTSLWQGIVQHPAIEAMDLALQSRGYTFDEELSLFYGWNYLTGSRADTSRFYPEGDTYPEIVLDAFYAFTQDMTITNTVKATASRYYQFEKADSTIYTLIPTNVKRDTSSAFILSLLYDGSGPFYTDLTGGTQANLSPGDSDVWRCVAVVESPGQQALFIPFEPGAADLETDDLPSCFPNPFLLQEHDQTTIPFVFQETGQVNILILDAAGFRVKKEGQYYVGGSNDADVQFYSWNGRDDSGQLVSTGIYMYLLTYGNTVIRKGKLAVIR